jgi:hypothetical protein
MIAVAADRCPRGKPWLFCASANQRQACAFPPQNKAEATWDMDVIA